MWFHDPPRTTRRDVPTETSRPSSVRFGSVTALLQSLFSENEMFYLSVTVDPDDEMVPRELLASAPWAMEMPDNSLVPK